MRGHACSPACVFLRMWPRCGCARVCVLMGGWVGGWVGGGLVRGGVAWVGEGCGGGGGGGGGIGLLATGERERLVPC